MDGHIKGITILGSTGSVGTQAIGVINQFPDKLKVIGLAAKNSYTHLSKQILQVSPLLAFWEKSNQSKSIMKNFENMYADISDLCTHNNVDIVLTATTGIASIYPTIEAIKSGKNIVNISSNYEINKNFSFTSGYALGEFNNSSQRTGSNSLISFFPVPATI